MCTYQRGVHITWARDGSMYILHREVSFIRRLKCTGIIGIGTSRFVLYREVSFFSECPLSEVPLYLSSSNIIFNL